MMSENAGTVACGEGACPALRHGSRNPGDRILRANLGPLDCQRYALQQ